MNLYPWNYILLYASCVCLIIALVILFRSLLALKKTADTMQPALTSMQSNLELINIKTSAVQEKKAEDAKKNRVWMIAMPILLAVYDKYRKDPEASGPSGVIRSAKNLAADEVAFRKLVTTIRNKL